MAEEQPGLRRRLRQEERRISSQHRQLNSFYAALAEALEDGPPEEARQAFLRFSDALDAHFTVEEQLHFPAIHGLWPELDAELATLVREHEAFRDDLGQLRKLVEGPQPQEAAERLEIFVSALTAHEQREEDILARVRSSGQGR